MNAPTKECPYCHKQINMFGLNYAKHLDHCEKVYNPVEWGYKHTLNADPECQCVICTMGFDAWLWQYHPAEY